MQQPTLETNKSNPIPLRLTHIFLTKILPHSNLTMYQAFNANATYPNSQTNYFTNNNNDNDQTNQLDQQQYCVQPFGSSTEKTIASDEQGRLSFTFEEIGAIIDEDFKELQQQLIDQTVPTTYPQQQQQSYYTTPDWGTEVANGIDVIPGQEANDDKQDSNQILTAQQLLDPIKNEINYLILEPEDQSITHQYQQHGNGGSNNHRVSNHFMTNDRQSTQNMAHQHQQQTNHKSTIQRNLIPENRRPHVEIVEQPAKCSLRFRYRCEGRSAGALPGINSTMENKTYPSIKIHDYVGRAVVVVSCVTKDAPYKAHPHNIVGKEGCKKGICTIVINNELDTIKSFSSLGIQCVKKKDIDESLSLRESINVDPFRNGFEHKLCGSTIDLNVVRLCFQVFIEGSIPFKCDIPLVPVVSDPIHDKKAMSDLVITKLSHCSAPATGGREVILLCDRISKDDIQIRFYEERDEKLIWETHTDLAPTDIHKQVAICFKTPKYYNENITQPVMCKIQLKRISDKQVSEPRLFQFLPCESDEDIISRKRQKIEWVNMNYYALDNILQPNQAQAQHNHHHQQQHQQQAPIQNQHQVIHQHQLRPQSSMAQNCMQHQQIVQHHRAPDATPSPSQGPSPMPMQQQAPSRPASESPRPSSTSPVNDQQQHQAHNDRFMIEDSNLVIRREIIDNEGKIVRLVDRQADQRQPEGSGRDPNSNIPHVMHIDSKPLGNSLDRIDTAELMRDMQFNSNMDFNLGSSLSFNLNGNINDTSNMNDNQQIDSHHQRQLPADSTSMQRGNNPNKNC